MDQRRIGLQGQEDDSDQDHIVHTGRQEVVIVVIVVTVVIVVIVVSRQMAFFRRGQPA